MNSILKVKDKNGKWIDIPGIVGPQGPAGESGGIKTYAELPDKPTINGIEIEGIHDLWHYGIQSELKPGVNIKNINGQSLIGSGNIEIEGGSGGITEIPIASKDTLGGIKVGANLSITEDGTLNAVGGGSGEGAGYDDVPIYTIVEYEGEEIPDGWVEVEDGLNVTSVGTVLFESQEGSNQNITLSEAMSGFEYVDITYGIANDKRVRRIAGDTPAFSLDRLLVAGTSVYARLTTYSVSGANINVSAYALKYDTDGRVITEPADASPLVIFKVVGYNQTIGEVIIEKDYSSITAANQTEVTEYKSYGWVDAPLDRVVTQVGDKLTLVDNGVRIGPGVSHVRVSGYGIVTVQNSTSTSTYEYMFAIRKNADAIMWNRVPIKSNTTINNQITVIPAQVIPVVEGDMIYLSSYSTTGQLSRTIHNNCFLNVEVAGDVVKTEIIEYKGVTDYSTEETVIGTYMGKPLYRKCYKHQFKGSYNDVAASGQMISWIYNATGAEVESIIRLDARAVNPGWDRIASLGYSFTNSFGSIEYRTQSGSRTDVLQIGLIKDNPMYSDKTIVLEDTLIDIIFEYTKATD